MREYVLTGNDRLYKIGLNGKNGLSLITFSGAGSSAQRNLTSHPCDIFSADIDINETLHLAAVSESALTYIRIKDGRTTTTHLMHLPQGFELTSLCLRAEETVTLNYTVKSHDGCALIEYTLMPDGWHGRNICTVESNMRLLAVSERACYIEEASKEGYRIKNAAENEDTVALLNSPAEYAQALRDGIIYVSDSAVYKNECEICVGKSVYVLEDDRILCGGDTLFETVLSGDFRISGRVRPLPESREYVLCSPDKAKRIILSPPFPNIKTEPAREGMLTQEVYTQQKQIFALQAEIKSLKSRLRRIEEVLKNPLN